MEVRRVAFDDGSFVDAAASPTPTAVRALSSDAPTPDRGALMRGVVVCADGGEHVIVSCGGLLARVRSRDPEGAAVRLHVT